MMCFTFSVIGKLLNCIIAVNAVIGIDLPVTLDFAADGGMVMLQAPTDLSQR
jgi:hypothetical protein